MSISWALTVCKAISGAGDLVVKTNKRWPSQGACVLVTEEKKALPKYLEYQWWYTPWRKWKQGSRMRCGRWGFILNWVDEKTPADKMEFEWACLVVGWEFYFNLTTLPWKQHRWKQREREKSVQAPLLQTLSPAMPLLFSKTLVRHLVSQAVTSIPLFSSKPKHSVLFLVKNALCLSHATKNSNICVHSKNICFWKIKSIFVFSLHKNIRENLEYTEREEHHFNDFI